MRAVIIGPAEFGRHVFEGGLGLGPVPGFGLAAGGDVGGVVAVPGVPHDDEGAGDHFERDGPLDGAADPVRASSAPSTLRVLAKACSMLHRAAYRWMSSAGAVARSVLTRARSPALSSGQDDPHGGGVQAAVPQAGDLGQVRGLAAAVDLHGSRGPGRGGGQAGRVPRRDPLRGGRPGLRTRGGAGAYKTAFLGSRVVQVTVGGQVPQRGAVIGRVRHHVHRAAGERRGQPGDQRRRAADLAGRRRVPFTGLAPGRAGARHMQPGQHRQASGCAKRTL